MTVRIISKRLDPRNVVLKLVDGSIVKGKINLHHDQAQVQRVSDIFTKVQDPYIVVFDATAEGRSGRVLVVNKRNLIWVSPED